MNESSRPFIVVHVLTIIDGATDDLVDLVEITNFDLERFRTQFDVSTENDPDMLDRYAVGPDDADFVNEMIGRNLSFNFTQFGYFIEAAKKDL